MVHDDELDDLNEEARPPGHWRIGLEGRLWTVDDLFDSDRDLPEKMELIDGKLFWSERERVGMLAAMLEQMGLVAVVRLAPKELWLEALRQAEANEP